jgi:hypothetical protein
MASVLVALPSGGHRAAGARYRTAHGIPLRGGGIAATRGPALSEGTAVVSTNGALCVPARPVRRARPGQRKNRPQAASTDVSGITVHFGTLRATLRCALCVAPTPSKSAEPALTMRLVGAIGIEPTTPTMSRWRSFQIRHLNQLVIVDWKNCDTSATQIPPRHRAALESGADHHCHSFVSLTPHHDATKPLLQGRRRSRGSWRLPILS